MKDIDKLLSDIEFKLSTLDNYQHEQWTTNREGLNLCKSIIDLIAYVKELEDRIEKVENKLVSQDININSWYDCIKDYFKDESKNIVVFTKRCIYQVTDQDEYYVYVLDAKKNEYALTYDEMKEHFKI